MDEFIDLLKQKADLRPSQCSYLKSLMEFHHYKKGTVLHGTTDVDRHIYFIKKGGARSFYLKDGKDITFSFAFDNDLLISVRSDLTKKTYPELVEFMEDSDTITMRIKPFNEFRVFTDLNFATLYCTLMLEYTFFLEERIINQQHKSAKERYEWITSRHPQLLQRASLGQIASFLGITPETLSRIRSEKKLSNGL